MRIYVGRNMVVTDRRMVPMRGFRSKPYPKLNVFNTTVRGAHSTSSTLHETTKRLIEKKTNDRLRGVTKVTDVFETATKRKWSYAWKIENSTAEKWSKGRPPELEVPSYTTKNTLKGRLQESFAEDAMVMVYRITLTFGRYFYFGILAVVAFSVFPFTKESKVYLILFRERTRVDKKAAFRNTCYYDYDFPSRNFKYHST
uniref:Transmembrane protein n=1 Tax=Steinernema glaseri TaxID=37863 RepID=A0A1I7ZME9_9BILA